MNSYDTWHGKLKYMMLLIDTHALYVYLVGTKNVAKSLAKVTKGRGIDVIKDELLDKCKCIVPTTCTYVYVYIPYNVGASTKHHLYWCMKNCNSDPSQLQSSIIKHYQVLK